MYSKKFNQFVIEVEEKVLDTPYFYFCKYEIVEV